MNNKKFSEVIMVFEHMLALVTKTYYDSDYQVEGILREIIDMKKKLKIYGEQNSNSRPKL
jgi:hypothetical protein